MAHVAPHHPEVAPTAVAEEPMLIHHWAESGGRFAEVHAEANYNRGSRRTKCLIHCRAEGGGSLAEGFAGSKAKTHVLNPEWRSMRKDGGRSAEERQQKCAVF